MSRRGNKPIELPEKVEVVIGEALVSFKGPKGKIEQPLMKGITVRKEEQNIFVEIDKKVAKLPFLGLYWSLINNCVTGVFEGFEKRLNLIGVGYRAAVNGKALDLQLGFSHPCQVAIPEELDVTVEKATTVSIKGVNKRVVGQFAADVRALRPPEPYKGKGVRLEGEYVRRKAGKAAKGK